MKKIIFYILIILLCMTAVAGGNSSTHTYIQDSDLNNVQIVYADADGHFNIPFSDGSKGYCLEYMEEEAVKGDAFIIKNTSFAINNRTGEDVSNLLKVYFIDYDGYKADPVVAQHMIWHFTDDFDGWRINKTLVEDIKLTSSYKKYPDLGTIRFNETHNMGFKFNSFISPYANHQNYWGYDVFFKLIQDCSNITNIYNNITNINITNNTYNNFTTINVTNINNTYQNITNIKNFNVSYVNNTNISNINYEYKINNDTYNNYTIFIPNYQYNYIYVIYNLMSSINYENSIDSPISSHVNMMETGNNIWVTIILLAILLVIVIIHERE